MNLVSRGPEPRVASELGEKVPGGRVLIVDEVDDTRTTLEYAIKEVMKDGPSAVAVACVHNKKKEFERASEVLGLGLDAMLELPEERERDGGSADGAGNRRSEVVDEVAGGAASKVSGMIEERPSVIKLANLL